MANNETTETTSDPRIKPISTDEWVKPVSRLGPTEAEIHKQNAFAAQLFRKFEKSGDDIAALAGETAPAVGVYMSGWRDAFKVAARVMDWGTGKSSFTPEEMAQDVAEPVIALIESLIRASGRAYQAGRDGNGA